MFLRISRAADAVSSPMSVAATVAAPPPGTDYVRYLAWYLVYARMPLEVIAHRQGIALDAMEKLPAGPEGDKDRAFYQGKRYAATYFARSVLPGVRHDAEIMGREDGSPLEIANEAFASI